MQFNGLFKGNPHGWGGPFNCIKYISIVIMNIEVKMNGYFGICRPYEIDLTESSKQFQCFLKCFDLESEKSYA